MIQQIIDKLRCLLFCSMTEVHSDITGMKQVLTYIQQSAVPSEQREHMAVLDSFLNTTRRFQKARQQTENIHLQYMTFHGKQKKSLTSTVHFMGFCSLLLTLKISLNKPETYMIANPNIRENVGNLRLKKPEKSTFQQYVGN